jgi:hypothetical protein
MASASLQKWLSTRAAELDRIAAAHKAVGGSGRGRRWVTQQINQAYAMLTLPVVKGWRRACNGLALSFDRIMAHHIKSIAGTSDWSGGSPR